MFCSSERIPLANTSLSRTAPGLCGHWRKSSTFTQSDVGGELGLEAFAAEVSPFKCFIAGHKRV